jgi:alpha-L-arabinofuranosidase
MLSRRCFSKSILAAPWILRAQQGALKARVKIDTERTIGDIDPKVEDKQFSGSVEAIEVNGPDIKAANTFEGAPVKPTQRTAPAQGKTLQYSFPPHSFTMLRAKLA